MTRITLGAALLMSVASASVAIGGPDAAAADPGPGTGQHASGEPALKMQWEKTRAEETQARLDRDAARLEIKASQEPAWTDYSAALKALSEPPRGAAPLPPNADAAALARARAEDAAAMAQKLSRLADATVKLQAVLTPSQREVLNQIARLGHREFPPMHRGVVMTERGPGDGMRWGPGPVTRQEMGRELDDGDGPVWIERSRLVEP